MVTPPLLPPPPFHHPNLCQQGRELSMRIFEENYRKYGNYRTTYEFKH
jgi:hypothetical protein